MKSPLNKELKSELRAKIKNGISRFIASPDTINGCVEKDFTPMMHSLIRCAANDTIKNYANGTTNIKHYGIDQLKIDDIEILNKHGIVKMTGDRWHFTIPAEGRDFFYFINCAVQK